MMTGRFTAALAFALLATATPQFSLAARAAEVETSKSAAVGATEINIARIKNALKLTAAQQASWSALENTLLTIAREQAQKIASAAQPASRHIVAISFNDSNTQRLAAAAMPLVKMLNADQRKIAQGLAQQIGLGAYASFI